jgi:chemotaxis response regulator CheB
MPGPALETLQAEGHQYLKRFVEEVNGMTSYPRHVEEKQAKSETKEGWISKVQKSGYTPVLVRFSVWFILILLLTTGGIYLASLKFTLTPDTMATLIIGTSVGGAAALTAILPKRGKEQ